MYEKFTKTRATLCVALLASVFILMSMTAQAQFAGGTGTEQDPYQINSAIQLAALANYVNGLDISYNSKHYKLTANIDLSVYNDNNNGFNNGKGWIPIGISSTYPFKGNFDGNNNKITGLHTTDTTYNYLGLFGYINNGTIKNLGVENVNILIYYYSDSPTFYAGGVVGYCVTTQISNCYSTGKIRESGYSYTYVGGIVGRGIVTISNCYSTMNIESDYGGGVIAYLDGSTVNNCYSTGTVNGFYAGGVVGVNNYGTVFNCYSTGTVGVGFSGYAGGVVGRNFLGNVSNCYSTGVIQARYYAVGGVVGENYSGTVSNCAALNSSVKGTGPDISVGRIAAEYGNTLSNNVAWNGIINNNNNSNWSNKHQDSINGADILIQTIYIDGTLGNRFTNASGWTTQTGKLPGFGNAIDMPLHLQNHSGTELDPYIITTAEQLAQLATFVNNANPFFNNKCYKLGNDIDISSYNANYIDVYGNKGWEPIGLYTDIPFKGVFDGNNYKITGLYIDGYYAAGLFGYIDNGTVKNLGVENVNINMNIDNASLAGGIVGSININGTVSNCYSTGVVTVAVNYNASIAGGVVGNIGSSGTVSNCYSTVTVTARIAGGIVGSSGSSNVSNCYSTGTVTATGSNPYAGGIVGTSVWSSNVSNCYSTGTVTAISGSAGGVVGGNGSSSNVSNCYSTGTVSGRAVGGVVGGVSTGGNVLNCTALNPSVKGTDLTGVGRVAGYGNTLSNNVAWDGILNNSNNINWYNKGANQKDGVDISKQSINLDGTLGGRFTAPVWTTQNGKLPGLFGNTVDMPCYLHRTIINYSASICQGDIYSDKNFTNLTIDSIYYRTFDCDSIVFLTLTVNPILTPTFTGITTEYCIGANIPALPTISNNGITGTWTPSINNITTTTYTFTPTAGQCVTTSSVTVTITINPLLTPTFTGITTEYCAGATIPALPTTSNNGITGTWTPSINNTTTTTYTFTPTVGQCVTTSPVTVTITINPLLTPTFTGIVTGYCAGANISALPTTSNNGITGTWSPPINNTTTTTYTFIPTAGQCATTAQITITVNPLLMPTFTGIVTEYCAGATIPALPTTSNNGITGTWAPSINNTTTTTYTFTPTVGQCVNTTPITITITINPLLTPTFIGIVTGYCAGTNIPALPTTSNNGITGTWSPPINNTTTTTYTFTPTTGQCVAITPITVTITINPLLTPIFTGIVTEYCAGAVIPALPITSNNGITGTWAPSINNTATTTYTFTPTAGQCVTTSPITITITVNPLLTPTFIGITTEYCSGATIPPLPTTSSNGISGSWAPSINNTATTTYTFTPTAGQCVTPPAITITITINPNVTPEFSGIITEYPAGANIPLLPLLSDNDISGTWSPPINNTATTTYTFTPIAGQCVTTTPVTITITITVGIDDVLSNQLKIFPNPTNDELFIKSDLLIKKVEIYSIIGNLLISENNSKDKISVSTLPAGIYFLKVYTDKNLVISKVVKN